MGSSATLSESLSKRVFLASVIVAYKNLAKGRT